MSFTRETKLSIAVAAGLSLVLLGDLNSRILLPAVDNRGEQSVSAFEPIDVKEFRHGKGGLESLLNELDPPPPKQPDAEADKPKPPPKPKGPTKEERLQRLVDGGAKRLGADVVYLRGVLIDDQRYALMVLVDDNLNEKSVTVTLGDKLGDFKLSNVARQQVTFVSGDSTVVLKLFDKSGSSQ